MTIPDTITVQDRLLTIDTNAAPIIRDVLVEGVNIQPLYLDAENGLWVLRVIFAPGITMPRHFHTGTVHLWTLSGSWNYLEYPDQPQTAGIMDAGWIAEAVNAAANEQGLGKASYIRPGHNACSDE